MILCGKWKFCFFRFERILEVIGHGAVGSLAAALSAGVASSNTGLLEVAEVRAEVNDLEHVEHAERLHKPCFDERYECERQKARAERYRIAQMEEPRHDTNTQA